MLLLVCMLKHAPIVFDDVRIGVEVRVSPPPYCLHC